MTFNDKIDQFMKDNNIKDLKALAIKADIPYTTLRDFYAKKSADNSRLSTIRKLSKGIPKLIKAHADNYNNVMYFANNVPHKNTLIMDIKKCFRSGGFQSLKIIKKYNVKPGSNFMNILANRMILLFKLYDLKYL